VSAPHVLVIGGGPAGACAAAFLARGGAQVTVLERARFPRPHVGESLQPATFALLDRHFSLGPRVAAKGWARKYGAIYVWGETREPWSVLFDARLEADLPGLDEAALIAGDYEHAWQVDRASFDAMLLDLAIESGAEVRQETPVRSVWWDDDRAIGVHLEDGGSLRADFVIDATGQRCLISRSRGLLRPTTDLRSTAAYAYFRGAGGRSGPLGRHVQQVISLDEGWVWFIPISTDMTSIGVVTRARQRLGADAFASALQQAGLPLEGAEQVSELRYVRDWSYSQRQMIGPGWALVGDAACFVDPILSGGVDAAVRGGCGLGLALLRGRGRPEAERSALLAAWAERVRQEYRAYLGLARYWYGNNRSVDGLFWQARQRVPRGAAATPLRAFVYLTTGRYAVDRHFRVFDSWQERRIFEALGVDRAALRDQRSR